MSERFYINCPLEPGPVTLEGDEAHHLAVVCRLRPGDRVFLFNGDGHEYPACLKTVSRRLIDLEVSARHSPNRELPITIEVAVSLPRGDRSQFLVEKLTELGATTLVPLACQRSVVHPRETRLEKLQRHVIEASKQCGRNILMKVAPVITWTDYSQQPVNPGTLRLLAHPGDPGEPGKLPPAHDYHLAIGPEGGFTDEEVALAVGAGWQPVTLGPRVLRVETAAMVMTTLLAQSAPANLPSPRPLYSGGEGQG